MRQYIEQYLSNCPTCRQVTLVRHSPFRSLKLLPVPHGPWQKVSMDSVTCLSLSEDFDAILVIVDCLTRKRHLITCNKTAGVTDVARICLDHVWKLHGLPQAIVCDRGPRFIATFCSSLCRLLQITTSTIDGLTLSDRGSERASQGRYGTVP